MPLKKQRKPWTADYRDYMEALITGWRTVFKNENAPFYFVQLAPFIYKNEDPTNLPAQQNAQRLAAETIPNTGVAVTTDIGNLKNIHPGNKSEVGRRLSLLALASAYTTTESKPSRFLKNHRTLGTFTSYATPPPPGNAEPQLGTATARLPEGETCRLQSPISIP